MSKRINELKALWEKGTEDAQDASLDQTLASVHNDQTLGLESDSSIDLQATSDPRGALLLSTTEDSMASERHSAEESSSGDLMDEPLPTALSDPAATPRKSTSSASATPRKPPQSASTTPRTTGKSSSYTTPAAEDSTWDHDDSSLSTSLRASQLMRGNEAVDELLEEEEGDATSDRSNSGQWGVQEMKRRTAAGISIKSTQQKIDQLTAERDDLKIEVDFHRRNMSPEDVGAEVISLRQEKLSYVRRLQKLNDLVKGQDQALKTVNKQVKGWETKLQDYDALQEQLRRAEERAAAAEAKAAAARPDDARVASLEAKLRSEQANRASLEDELAALRDDTQRQRGHQTEVDELHEDIAERDELIDKLRADLIDAEKELDYFHANPDAPDAEAMVHLQRQVEEQSERIGSLQDALDAERLLVAEKDGELDRLDQVQREAEAAYAALENELAVRTQSETAALSQARELDEEVQRLEQSLEEAHSYHEGLSQALKEKLSDTAVQLHEAQQSVDALSVDVDQLRTERDSLLDAVERHSAKRGELEELNTRLNEKLVELVKDLKDEETARERADSSWSQRYDSTEVQTQRALQTKNELIESLERQLVQTRSDKQQLEKEHAQLQRAMQLQDTKQLRRSEDQATERQTLEAERARHQRESKRLAAELERVQDELASMEDRCQDAEAESQRLKAETKELVTALQTETRTRVVAQERLDQNQRSLDEARHDLAASGTRSRMSEQSSRTARRGDAQQQAQLAERNSLLATVYETLTKALAGADQTTGTIVRTPSDAAQARGRRWHLVRSEACSHPPPPV